MGNPYSVLKIPNTSSVADAKKAYKKLANIHHPDKGGDIEKFKEIKNAYEQIKQVTKVNTTQSGHHNFKTQEDIYNYYKQYAHVYAKPNPVIKVSASISVKKAVLGGEYTLAIQNNYITITLPKNIHNLEVVKFPKQLNAIDLYIKFTIIKDNVWEIKNNDLYKTEDINVFKLITGTSINVETIDDKTIKVKIPKNTQCNTKLKIQQQGITDRSNLLKKGDLYIILNPIIPNKISVPLFNTIQQEIQELK